MFFSNTCPYYIYILSGKLKDQDLHLRSLIFQVLVLNRYRVLPLIKSVSKLLNIVGYKCLHSLIFQFYLIRK